jgi:hypothetical protein
MRPSTILVTACLAIVNLGVAQRLRQEAPSISAYYRRMPPPPPTHVPAFRGYSADAVPITVRDGWWHLIIADRERVRDRQALPELELLRVLSSRQVVPVRYCVTLDCQTARSGAVSEIVSAEWRAQRLVGELLTRADLILIDRQGAVVRTGSLEDIRSKASVEAWLETAMESD